MKTGPKQPMKPLRKLLSAARFGFALFSGILLELIVPLLCPLLIILAAGLCLKGWFLEGLVITFAAWVIKEK